VPFEYLTDLGQALRQRDEARAKLKEAVELLRAYNTWAGTRELDVGERSRLLSVVSHFLIEVAP
jgi:hypothetical protein